MIIKHKHINNFIVLLVIITILICVGGIFTGLVTQEYEELKKNPKIEADIVDKIQEQGFAEVIIELNSPSTTRSIQSGIPDFKTNYEYSNINAISGELNKEILKDLVKNSQVKKIYLNKNYNINIDDSIPLIKANEVHEAKRSDVELKGNGFSVCLIDTGVNYNHPALSGRIILGRDFVNSDSNPMDDNGHGTHIAGIIASDDSTYTGVAPQANIVAIKACDSNGNCSQANILAGIDWCINNASLYNITVISMSLGDDGEYDSGTCPTDFNSIINNATSNGIFVTISSGNNGHDNGISSPACSANATSVGATDKSDNLWGGTNIGNLLDLLAPGINIQSCDLGSSFTSKDGTSIANAHVAGAAILIYQNKNLSGQSITPLEVRDLLKNNGVDISSYPRVNVKEAVLESGLDLSWDINPYPKTNANIYFNAEYKNKTSNSSVTSATCRINFSDSQNNLMGWNATTETYQYIRNFTSPATYNYNVSCNHTNFETLRETSNVEVVQGSENCTYPGSNIDWELSGSGFSRCVGEDLIINQSNINVKDNSEFVLKDTNLTLIGASTHYVINVSSSANFSLENVYIKGMDQTTRRLDIDIYGHGDIYNSTFENSRLIIEGVETHEVANCNFLYLSYFQGSSINNIINSNFTNYIYFHENSLNNVENCNFNNRFYTDQNSNVIIKNSNLNSLVLFQGDSIINFTETISNLTNEIRSYDRPKIYGIVDMPPTGSIITENLTRYYPVYVYQTGTSTPHANKEVRITDSNGNLIWQGTTNSQGYVEPSLVLNTTNYGSGNFTISTNSSSEIVLLTDTPINLEATAPDEDDGGSSGGGSSTTDCIEDWECEDWEDCINGTQNRTCIDTNYCETELDKPNETRICFIPFNTGGSGGNPDDSEESGYVISAERESGSLSGKDCCLIGICWFRYIICWYWWLLMLIIVLIDLVAIWRIKKKRKKRFKESVTQAVGIDWVLKKTHLQ